MFKRILFLFIASVTVVSCAHSPKTLTPSPHHYGAAASGKVELLKELTDEQLNLTNQMGTSLLMVAARRNRLDSVLYLLERGARTDLADVHRQTALHYSLPTRNRGISQALLRAGADPSVTDEFGVVPAVVWANENAIELLAFGLEQKNTWCCYNKIRQELKEILHATVRKNKYIPPTMFLILRDLEEDPQS